MVHRRHCLEGRSWNVGGLANSLLAAFFVSSGNLSRAYRARRCSGTLYHKTRKSVSWLVVCEIPCESRVAYIATHHEVEIRNDLRICLISDHWSPI